MKMKFYYPYVIQTDGNHTVDNYINNNQLAISSNAVYRLKTKTLFKEYSFEFTNLTRSVDLSSLGLPTEINRYLCFIADDYSTWNWIALGLLNTYVDGITFLYAPIVDVGLNLRLNGSILSADNYIYTMRLYKI